MAGSNTADAPFPFAGGAHFINGSYRGSRTERAHILRCRGSFPFPPGRPGNVPFWHVMPWSLHFTARKRKVAKKRGRRPGENPCRRAPTPSPPTLTLSVPIHFDSPIKEIPCLRTLPIHLPTSAPPGHNGKHPRMAPKEPTRLSSNARIPISPVWLRRV